MSNTAFLAYSIFMPAVWWRRIDFKHQSNLGHARHGCTSEFGYRPTDIERRSQNSTIALCNGIVSHRAPIGGIRVFADHTRGNKQKQNAPTIFAHRAMFHVCLSSRLDCNTYAPDESLLF